MDQATCAIAPKVTKATRIFHTDVMVTNNKCAKDSIFFVKFQYLSIVFIVICFPHLSADVDECKNSPCPSGGACHNTIGGYRCSCRVGLKFSAQNNSCDLDTSLIIGVTLGSAGGILFLAAVVAVLTRRWQRIVQKRLRKVYFRKNKGILLEQLISSDNTASDGTKIFSLNELE